MNEEELLLYYKDLLERILACENKDGEYSLLDYEEYEEASQDLHYEIRTALEYQKQ